MMNHRLLHFCILLCLVASITGTGTASAAGPKPPVTPAAPPPQVPSVLDTETGSARQLLDLGPGSDLSADTLSQNLPGLAFRYLRSYGQTGVAYADDTSHLNYAWGLGTDSAGNIWIGELRGNRVVKYDNTGAPLQQIGIAGLGSYPSSNPVTYLWEIADVAVDNSGNIWVVDAGTGHVAEFNSAGVFQKDLGVPWVHGSDNGHFMYPVSVAFDSANNIYVSDGAPWSNASLSPGVPAAGNQRIQVFNGSGTRIATIGVTGVAGADSAHFNGPRHLVIDQAAKLLYVADTGNNRVQIFNITNPAAPTYAGTLAPSGTNQLNNPSGVAIDATYIYVADTDNSLVKVFNRSTLAYVARVGDGVTGAYQLDAPYDVAVDAAGNVYVADFGNIRVQKYTFASSTFTYSLTYGSKGVPYLTDGMTYNRPSGIAVASDGSVFVTEDDGERLIKAGTGGSPIWTVGTPGVRRDWDMADYRLSGPADVALDSTRVFVADRSHDRVQVYAQGDGTYLDTIDLPGGCPGGVAVSPIGTLFVANTCKHTVLAYNSSLTLVATLGVSGAVGSDNNHFNSPEDVAVDGNGTIYVSDQNNQRVQVFNSSLAYTRTIGVNGSCGGDFARLCLPDGLALDSYGDVYVVDAGNNRVEVFDTGGGYLTTLGGLWGPGTGQMRSPAGIAVDSSGNVYVADKQNHRIQKFSPSVPSWTQRNFNGFGDRSNGQVSALAGFGSFLYAGTTNNNGAQLWRSADGVSWSPVMTNGFGNSKIVGFDDLLEFNGQLYAGLWGCASQPCTSLGGQVYRSSDGATWTPVTTNGFNNDLSNGEVYKFVVFNNVLYAATWSWNSSHGGEIWSSSSGDAGDWTRSVYGGFGNTNNWATTALRVFNGYLYAGTYNRNTGAEIWRCSVCAGSGTDWTPVSAAGLGDTGNIAISSIMGFGSYLYASTQHASGAGAELWRCQLCDGSDWVRVVDNGFGNAFTGGDGGLEVFNGQLNFIVDNPDTSTHTGTGTEVWRCTTCNGSDWVQVGFGGFGDSNNGVHAGKSAQFAGRLYYGTVNYASGGEVWTPPALPYPVVNSIRRADPSPTSASLVNFIVSFSEAVINVGADDFVLTPSAGISGASVIGVTGSGATYMVSVARGSGTGTLRLDLLDNNSILDELTGTKHLGGGGGAGSFNTGESYTIALVGSSTSLNTYDGWIVESGESSNKGGAANAKSGTLILGDSTGNQQYRSILSFDTSLPPGATINSLTLMIQKVGMKGSNPFLKLGSLVVDVKTGFFGSKPALQLGDFQVAPTRKAAFIIPNAPVNGWYSGTMGADADTLINKVGITQFRLRFTKDDNNNHRADYMTFYSGNAAVDGNRPLLLIQYSLP